MPVPATMLTLLLLSLTCAAQQSQNSDQSQGSSQPQSQNQSQAQPDKSSAKPRSTAVDNPFPEDISKKAAAAAGNSTTDAPPSSAPGSSAPSGDSSKAHEPGDKSAPATSSSRTGLQSLDDTPEGRISDGAGGYIYDPKLAAQDVKVAGFYLDSGNFEGAYSRFKEATRVDPGNSDAVFGLAEAARGLKRNSEAADNYRIYLDAVHNGSKAKAARKALAALGESAKK